MAYGTPENRHIPFQVVTVDQRRETRLSSVPNPRAAISYLYAPSYESRTQEVEGQDYVVLRHNERSVTFAVCDGVGQSFCGHLAAQFLGDALVEWLAAKQALTDEASLASRVTDFLTDLTTATQQRILEYPLPGDLAPLVKSALESQRAYGSETMFVCGRLAFPQVPTDPSDSGQLVLCWLGDVQAQIFDRQGRPIDIGAQWNTRERWSTKHGIKGAESVHIWIADLSEIGQVMAYSDGLGSARDRLAELVTVPDELQRQIERIYESPASDDISLVSVLPKRLPAPFLRRIRNPWFQTDYDLQWGFVPDAGGYLIEEADDPSFEDVQSWVTREPGFHAEGRPPGRHFYRVKAIYGALHGEPSNVQSARTLAGARFLKWALLVAAVLACLAAIALVVALVRFLPPLLRAP